MEQNTSRWAAIFIMSPALVKPLPVLCHRRFGGVNGGEFSVMLRGVKRMGSWGFCRC